MACPGKQWDLATYCRSCGDYIKRPGKRGRRVFVLGKQRGQLFETGLGSCGSWFEVGAINEEG